MSVPPTAKALFTDSKDPRNLLMIASCRGVFFIYLATVINRRKKQKLFFVEKGYILFIDHELK